MKTIAYVLLCALFLMNSPARADGDKGHGGVVIQVGKKLYLLDLLEAGLEKTPMSAYGAELTTDREMAIADRLVRDGIHLDVATVIISRIRNLPTSQCSAILAAIDLFNWRYIDLPLVHVHDVKTTLELDPKNVLQLAVRRDQTIQINTKLWRQMDLLNRTSLIFHEVFYASLQPQTTAGGFFAQDSFMARQIVADMMTPQNAHIRLEKYRVNDKAVLSFVDKLPGTYEWSTGFPNHDFIILTEPAINVSPAETWIHPTQADTFPLDLNMDNLIPAMAFDRCEPSYISAHPKIVINTNIIQLYYQLKDFPTAEGNSKFMDLTIETNLTYGEGFAFPGEDPSTENRVGRIDYTFKNESHAECEKHLIHYMKLVASDVLGRYIP
jgi:hypothetical protein